MSDLDNNTNSDNGDFEGVVVKAPTKKRKKNRVRSIIVIGIVAIAVGVFGFAMFKLISDDYGRKEARKKNQASNDMYTETLPAQSSSSGQSLLPGEDESGSASSEYVRLVQPTIRPDFDKLAEDCPNVIAWIEVPTCGIKYAVVQGEDNDFYLTHAYDDTASFSGAIFMDYHMEKNWSNYHMMMYGHHMNDGTMFANLLSYDKEDFFTENEGKNYFFIYTPENIRVYQIFSVCDVNIVDNSTAYKVDINSTFTIDDYVNYVRNVELYDTGIPFNGGQVMTLFTCQNDGSSNVRHLVHGQLVEKLEYPEAQ